MMRRIWQWGALGALCLIVLGAGAAVGQDKSAPKAEKSTTSTARGWLGVYTQELSSELREGMSYRGPGVLVSSVVDDSPAEKAGLRKGDVIVSVGTVGVDDPDELMDAVRARKSGETVSLKIVRDGKTLTLSPKLSSRPEGSDEFAPYAPFTSGPFEMYGDGDNDVNLFSNRGRLGVRVEDLNTELNAYFNAPGGAGALVVEVIEDSPAKKAGIKGGDVITSVAGSKIDDTEDLVRTLRKQDEGKVTVQVIRKGVTQSIEAELESRPYSSHYRTYIGPDLERQLRQIEPRIRERVRAIEIPNQDLRDEIEDLKRELEELKRELKEDR